MSLTGTRESVVEFKKGEGYKLLPVPCMMITQFFDNQNPTITHTAYIRLHALQDTDDCVCITVQFPTMPVEVKIDEKSSEDILREER